MRRFIALLLCMSLLLGGCRLSPAQTGPRGTSPARSERAVETLRPQGDEPETRTDEEILAAGEEAGEDIRAIFPDATFKANKAGAASLDYAGEAAELSVTDDAGLTWTLSIPEGALARPTTITMTPLADVDDGTGKRSGVLFGPSGLIFAAPATLAVTGPNADKVLLLYADEKGRDMTPAAFAAGGDSAEALMFHFSTAFADPIEFEKMKAEADRLYDKYYDKARKLLDKQIKPPKPMSLKLECFDVSDLPRIKAEVENAVKEEVEYASALLVIMNVALKSENLAQAQELSRLMLGLTQRAQQKLDTLLSLDNPKPESYFYAFRSMPLYGSIIALNFMAYAGDPNFVEARPYDRLEAGYKEFGIKLHAAGEYTWQYLLDGIVQEHTYTYIMAALVTESFLDATSAIDNISRGQPEDKSDVQHRRQQLSDACTFNIYFEGSVMQKRDSTAKWSTSGEGKVSLAQFMDDGTIEYELIFKGEAQGAYDHYSDTDPAAVKTLLTKDFTTEVHLVLELPCCLTGRAGVSQFEASELTYQSDIGPITMNTGTRIINQLALSEYYDALLQAVMAEITLTPGKALAEKKIDGKHEYTTVEYTIFLEHTPELGGG